MIMRALLMKNLWLWRPRRSANVAIFSVILAFSCADALWHFPVWAWAVACVAAAILGQIGGISALQVDLKDDAIQFLETLPVRWSHVWLANFIDGIATILLAIVLLCWHRVIFWSP